MDVCEPRSLVSSGFYLVGQRVPNMPEDNILLGD